MSSERFDAILFGGGLAGSILADTLLASGKRIRVVDQPGRSRCSLAAAGIINPIAGRRLNLAWMAETLIPYAKSYYAALGEKLGGAFFHPRPIARLFASDEERSIWNEKAASHELAPYIAPLSSLPFASVEGLGDTDGFAIPQGGYVDTSILIQSIHQQLRDAGILVNASFSYDEIQIDSEGVRWNGLEADRAIFCEGHLATANPWFDALPYTPAKGVIGRINAGSWPHDCILLKKYFLVPRHDGVVFLGATYDWNSRDDQPDEPSIAELETFARQNAKGKWSWDLMDAGVRPAIAGGKPVVGPHRDYPRAVAFNGFGSKGCMQIPYLANQLVQALWGHGQIPADADPNRFLNTPAAPLRWRATEIARDQVLKILRPGDTAIDATCGNGHDTLWLAERVGPTGRVHAFDIQAEAIAAADRRLREAGARAQATLHHTGHENIEKTLPAELRGQVTAIVFNLGYLPGGDKSIITRPDTTLAALTQAINFLQPGGLLTAVLYPAHPGGGAETNAVRQAFEMDQARGTAHKILENPSHSKNSPIVLAVVLND